MRVRVRVKVSCVPGGDCVALKIEELPFLMPVQELTVVVFVLRDPGTD